VSSGGNVAIRQGVIDETFHLSFPMSFLYDGRTWVVCEAATTGRTYLWEYQPETGRSRRVSALFDQPLRDVAVFRTGDRWELLGTSASPEWRLVRFISTSPLEGWAEAPVENTTHLVRLAGRPERLTGGGEADGEIWVVPMQGSSHGYGSEVYLCALELSPTARLQLGRRLDPPAPYIGMHTLAVGDSLNLVDLKHLRLRPDRVRHRLKPQRLRNRLRRMRSGPPGQ
jgi:hypothetical protein